SKIKDLINHVAKDSPYACDHVTAKLLAQLGNSVAACKKGLQGSKSASVKCDNTVKVSGSKAIADFTTSKGAPRHLSLVKDGSDWKIDAIS
ncbi:MAG: hypothetical protein QOG68_687, partial [Solirubrobacteraceae bacterium]|nr:hypothetical protein [Solirubrobacteraceae bacterium]